MPERISVRREHLAAQIDAISGAAQNARADAQAQRRR
jgi:hypothetical protein